MIEPTTEQELAGVVRGASAPVLVQGGGTRGVTSHLGGDVLSLSKMTGISLYEPGALTIVAGAGTPMAEIEAALLAEGQMLPFEPMDHRRLLGTQGTPTVGGVVGTNASGPRRLRAGACRDSLIGVRFVDGRGDILKNGGRVMKNVTGYDLVKLMAGSFGTLGVLSEVSIKLLPKPDTTGVVTLRDLSLSDGVAAMSAALGSPFEVSGAAMTPGSEDGAGSVVRLRLEGFENSVTYRGAQLQSALARFGDVEMELGGVEIWQDYRDASAFADKSSVWKVSMKASDVPTMLEAAIWPKFACEAILDWGGGLVWIGASEESGDAAVLHAALQAHVGSVGGHATLIKGSRELKSTVPVFQPESAPLAALATGLRAQFDPRGIFNPGIMG